MYFDTNISENKNGKKIEGSYWSGVTNDEFYVNISYSSNLGMIQDFGGTFSKLSYF